MTGYIIRRTLSTIPVILVVALVVFAILRLAPGDPAAILAGTGGAEVDPAVVEKIRKQLGLDQPLHVQLYRYFSDLARGDLGQSLLSKHNVSDLIRARVVPTISLTILTELIALIMAMPLGVLAAWKFNTWIDRVVMIFALVGYAVPYFFLGYMLLWAFAVRVHIFPAGGYTYFGEDFGQWLHGLLLPAMLLGITGAALITRMTRATMLEVLKEDYVRTARAKGVAEQLVLLRHALRNAANPILTIIGFSIAGLITGVVITETVFAIPGIGRLIVDAIAQRDYPIIQSMALVVAAVYVLVNLIIDVMYVYVDPRIRY